MDKLHYVLRIMREYKNNKVSIYRDPEEKA